ncbi:MAG: hypothetical protein ABSG68_07670 [Thermoguttaceae bacterium]|jgi:uncharacterized membrane protein (DUF106 family)
MLDGINHAILALADPLLNWLLRLPADLAVVIVAVGTGAIITLSRRFTTKQDLLQRCDQDKRRLKQLIREAKLQKDKEAVTRYRSTRNMIGMMTVKEEGWPLLAAIGPIAILGTWCFQRLAFVPPRAGETVAVRAYFPVSAVGELAHLVPQEGVREVSGDDSGGSGHWIQEIINDDPGPDGIASSGIATWKIQAGARPEPYALEIRCKTVTVQKELLVGQPVYSPNVEFYGADQPVMSARIDMKPVKFLGFVPGIDRLLMPPWLVAYFLIAIPSVSLIKRVTGIY